MLRSEERRLVGDPRLRFGRPARASQPASTHPPLVARSWMLASDTPWKHSKMLAGWLALRSRAAAGCPSVVRPLAASGLRSPLPGASTKAGTGHSLDLSRIHPAKCALRRAGLVDSAGRVFWAPLRLEIADFWGAETRSPPSMRPGEPGQKRLGMQGVCHPGPPSCEPRLGVRGESMYVYGRVLRPGCR